MSKILIVDDDPHIRELSSLFLRNDGFEVYEASDGADAISKLNTIKVDLFVIDVMMPNMDGWELCRELRAAGLVTSNHSGDEWDWPSSRYYSLVD